MQWLTNLLLGSKNSDREIRNIFFELIQENKGSITVIDLAMAADISGTDAKKILEQYAVEFDANFDVTEEGQVVYLFPTVSKSVSKKVFSEPQANSPRIESRNNNQSQSNQTSQERAKSPLADINNNVKQQVENINSDVKQKVEGIKKIESDLKEMGKSMNDLFKF